MRRPVLALALVLGALALASQQATTAGNTVPPSSLERGALKVLGGVQRGVSYSYLGQTSTGFTVNLDGSLVLKTVTARYDGAGPLVCVKGALVTSLLSSYTPVTCTGTAPESGLPAVTVTVS